MISGLNYNVIDVETNIKNQGEDAVGRFKASPFYHDNHIVLLGENHSADAKVDITSYPVSKLDYELLGLEHDQTIFVGHNIGFDLLYLYKDMPHMREKLERSLIWDTMIVEYLITGQEAMFVPLDKLAVKYGGTLKDEKIKEYWKANVDTEKIPPDELAEYLKHDCLNTERVFLAQMEKAFEQDQLALVRSQMDARLATVMMEWNGMHLDTVGLSFAADKLYEQIEDMEGNLGVTMRNHFDLPVGHKVKITPGSAVQLACFMWGGELNFRVPEAIVDPTIGDVVTYKTGSRAGQPKTKIVERSKKIPAFFSAARPEEFGATRGAKGYWSTQEAVLKAMQGDPRWGASGNDILDMLVTLRSMNKDYSAFYKGMGDLTWGDDCIHPTYNHAATNTGRLSCSKPNLQQVSGV